MQSDDTALPDTKTCTKCGEAKALDAFYVSPKGERYTQCRPCKAQAAIAHRASRDPEAYREAQRKYASENREKRRARANRHYAQNRDRLQEYARQWRAKHPDRASEASRRWEQKHPEQAAERRQRWWIENRERMLRHQANWRAENRDHRAEYDQHYYADHRDQALAKARRWVAKNPERARISKQATDKVLKAIRRGMLTRPNTCEECGVVAARIEAAHADYSQPLAVRWLCLPCHRRWDASQPKTLHQDGTPGIDQKTDGGTPDAR